ncbi:cobalamin biosynthesis protein [Motilimonas sp. 1_MG-2023]|uniref:cobalamin biosynthesis protein n=1 Tax=Motilimonas sp. 1_MG-2023 TaxID=3062672 RepID=UPI0026E119AA|nr:cobalamin biosynthesis protein [Motilimonas sp. 1_MG-2023]MDO6526894.1 cobalamin biosynthesis protein [Motilimonas sp. 1_MG-2023]
MIKIITLTETGHQLAKELAGMLAAKQACDIYYKPKPFAHTVQQAFVQGHSLIFICATGIVVRTLAPVLQDKLSDPPVLVLDELGQFVIPLLSGHEGGANQFASEVVALLNQLCQAGKQAAQLVQTTAKPYLAPIYTVGMGCERHCPEVELESLLLACLDKAGLSLAQVSAITSIDIKHDEAGLISLAKKLDKPFITFSAAALRQVEHLLDSKSEYIFNTVGVYGVAESAALMQAQLQANDQAELVLIKHKTSKATCAIARAYPLQVSQENSTL